MPITSAGLLLYRDVSGPLEVLLVHPGGPFWARRDEGAWSLPKGQVDPGEAPEAAAAREFAEELGHPAPPPPWHALGQVTQSGGKRVVAWAVAGDLDPAAVVSTWIEIPWPPRSGRTLRIPEVDRAAWFEVPEARRRLLGAQVPLVDRLVELLGR